MDEICEALSAKICSASNGGYSVFYEDELLEVFPCGDEKNRETLEAALKKLIRCGCIDVKYAKNCAFCIAGYKKYAPPDEAAAEPPSTDGDGTDLKKIYFLSLACGFAGSALGAMIAGLILAFAA